MKRIAENDAKMQAAGLGAFTNKVLQEKYQKVSRLAAEELNSQSESCSKGKNGKQSLTQKLSMAELLELKRSARQQNKRKGMPEQKQNEQHQLQSSFQMHKIQQKQDLAQQRKNSSQPPPKIQKFCAPGTLSRYKNMRKIQESRDQQGNDMDLNNSDLMLQHPRNANGGDLRPKLPRNANDGHLRRQHPSNDNDGVLRPQPPINDHDGDVRPEMSANANEDSTGFLEDATSDHNEIPDAHDSSLLVVNKADVEKKKHRGKTILQRIQTRSEDERDVVILNNMHQPVGSTTEIVKDFANFRGVLAKDSNYLPKNYISWHYVPDATKERVWEHIKTKFIVPKEGKEWVLGDLGTKWRTEKSKIRSKYYTKSIYETMEEKLAHPPADIPEDEFKDLMHMFDSKAGKEISEINKNNRKKQVDIHTMGPKSMARLRHDLQQKDPNKLPPSQAYVYMESRKRIDGRTYLTTNEDTLRNIGENEGTSKLE